MNWNTITEAEQINLIRKASHERPQLIFKHSSRCGISMGALERMENGMDKLDEKFDLYYLDLLSFRAISNLIADTFKVRHQSPQVIILKDGKAVFTASHGVISPEHILKNYPN